MRDLFNQKEFPVWEGYYSGKSSKKEQLEFVKKLWLNDIDLITKSLHENILEKEYYKEMLLYIQRKLSLDEPLGLCLNSAKEVLDIMITPCEILNDKGKELTELTLDDYYDIEEWTIEREDIQNPFSKQYMLCKTCDFATDDCFKFDEHKCNLDED